MIITSHGTAAVIATATYAKISGRKAPLTLKTIGKMFFFGILPDIPLTVLVLSNKFDPLTHYHHKWITHTPIFWLIVSLIVMLFFSRRIGLELLAATWLHLGMDWYGGADGIAFFYPFINKQYGVALSGINGPDSFRLYISNPFFLSLEIILQGIFLWILLAVCRRERK